ncbi:hypothetical protein HG535_0D04330 [Zygotorulaspora mrakii]|uniref:Large ribosomal subunit protein uL15/eL18 domain-containing protein n=1 Tax=Zygotorulaspora mrakii TaxID=42260 RepID=A0A7H9B251_ZYGMR|nr:uncharacterized protein HG535_0D04330 [Zygotorulaspora mrakii]QLG72725.1 hypothetical protein HG535_0D04330 [Zygotorulaspora mrakii]
MIGLFLNNTLNPCGLGGNFFSFRNVRLLSMLGTLRPSEGAVKKYRRVGRGPSSSKGKTSGRGQKGQKARGKVKSWFEGGQTPLYKLFPKIGFTNANARPLKELSLEKIQWFHSVGRLTLKEGEVLDMKKMRDVGLVTGSIKHGIKILGNGKTSYNLPIKIEASKATSESLKAIESAGGDFTARYYNRLGLRAHLSPNWFLNKRGRIPLQARPTRRKDIEYYSDESRKGYLVKESHDLLQQIDEAKRSGASNIARKAGKRSALRAQLDDITKDISYSSSTPFNIDSNIMTMEDFKQLKSK